MVFGRHTESVYSEDMSHAKKITDNQPLLDNLHRLMWEASDAIMSIYREDDFGETLKSDQSPVTRADLAAHHILIDGLTKLTKDIPVVSEEDPDSVAIGRHADCYWLIDPLDGTKEFINRNDEFTCNLALVEDHRPTLGFVSVPALGLLYYGGRDYVSKRIDRSGRCDRPRPCATGQDTGGRLQVTPQRRDPGLYRRDRGRDRAWSRPGAP